jgi:fibronectin type 3 domain-containing protein
MKKKLVLLSLVLALSVMTFGQTSSHGLALSWTLSTSTGVTGQNVYRSTVSGGPYSKLTTTPLAPTVTSYLDPVVDGKTYYYVVTAVQNGIESVYSNQSTATALGPAPNPQTGLAVSQQ